MIKYSLNLQRRKQERVIKKSVTQLVVGDRFVLGNGTGQHTITEIDNSFPGLLTMRTLSAGQPHLLNFAPGDLVTILNESTWISPKISPPPC